MPGDYWLLPANGDLTGAEVVFIRLYQSKETTAYEQALY